MRLNTNIFKMILSGVLLAGVVSCNDYLDTNPDRRTTIDTEQKAIDLLVSAYTTHQPYVFTELASDNIDDHGSNYTTSGTWRQFWEESYKWADVQASDNESQRNAWSGYYSAIASANQVLIAIRDLPMTDKLRAAKGEALICRAYAHFMLVNIFCQHYDPAHPDDLGIPYMEQAETELNPKYQRGTVAEVYAKIAADVEEGLPLISDINYSVPKYHFNVRAANAFAARFYLYYQKWELATQCATKALTEKPQSQLRDYAALLKYPTNNGETMNNAAKFYTSPDLTCNYMLGTSYSSAGYIFGGWMACARYSHGYLIATTESVNCTQDYCPFGRYVFKRTTLNFVNGLDKVLLPRIPYYAEITDPVAGTGYLHAIFPIFTAEETLLTRAEAFIMQKKYDEALDDMNIWVANTCSTYSIMTRASVNAWATSIPYASDQVLSPKKALHPAFQIESDTQENMLHALLYLRRIETLHLGLRWFDIKRMGIEISRRTLGSSDRTIKSIDDHLIVRDNRRAIQLPTEVISAGMEANPR